VLAAFGIAAEITLVATLSLRMLGVSCRQSLRTSLQFLSPFGAPRAAGVVTSAAVGPSDTLAPVAALLGNDRFTAWVRPWAYDVMAGRSIGSDELGPIHALVSSLPRSLLEQSVAAPFADDADATRYCPRCARTYNESAGTCNECDGLSLVTQQHHG